LIILFIFLRRPIGWAKSAFCLLMILILLVPVAYLNNDLYGSPLSFGYSQDSLDFSSVGAATSGLYQKLKQALFPFGLHPGLAIQNFYNYFIRLFPWFSLAMVFGLLSFFISWFRQWLNQWPAKINNGQKAYAVIFIFILFWLVLYYGSWRIQEFSDPDLLILGHSYLRYFLPLFVFSLPFVVYGYQKIARLIKNVMIQKVYCIVIFLLITILSWQTVIFDPLYGLAKVKNDIVSYQKVNAEVVALTPTDSVIVSGQADKVIFPQRQVIFNDQLDSVNLVNGLKQLSDQAPLYFYCQPVVKDCQQVLSEADNYPIPILLEAVATLSDQAVLYKLSFP
jgi:hypothetical protein